MSANESSDERALAARVAWLRSAGDVLGMLAALAALILVFGLLSNNFWSHRTAITIVNQCADLTVVAVGMTLVLVIAGIDLSVGSVMALSGAALGVAMADWNLPFGAAIFVCLGVGAACGLINGLVTVLWSIPSFIVTLGMLESARGATYLITKSETKYLGPSVEWIARPLPGLGASTSFLIALVVVAIGHVLLTRTVFGRRMIAIGTNEEAARLSGVDPRPTKLATFVISGLAAAIASIFQVARVSSADPNAGIGLELGAIAAVVIGGTSLMGGRGSVPRTFLGVLIIAVLQTGLDHIGATEPSKRLISGVVIVLAVIADVHRNHWSGSASKLWSRFRTRVPRKP